MLLQPCSERFKCFLLSFKSTEKSVKLNICVEGHKINFYKKYIKRFMWLKLKRKLKSDNKDRINMESKESVALNYSSQKPMLK